MAKYKKRIPQVPKEGAEPIAFNDSQRAAVEAAYGESLSEQIWTKIFVATGLYLNAAPSERTAVPIKKFLPRLNKLKELAKSLRTDFAEDVSSFGPTSEGKSFLLKAGASVSGLIGPDGIPGWADSEAAFEGQAMGHRDCMMPLDETADGEDKMPLVERAQMLAFGISRTGRDIFRRPMRNSTVSESATIGFSFKVPVKGPSVTSPETPGTRA
jgi:hypothetical protein